MQLSLMTFMIELPLLMGNNWQWNEQSTETMKQVLKDASEAGFQSVDLTFHTIRGMGTETVNRILTDFSLRVASVVCVGSLANEKMTDEEAEHDYREAILLAKAVGSDHLMLVPGFPVRGDSADTLEAALVRRFGHLVKAAASEGILCMIEDDPNLDIGMCTCDQVENLLRQTPGLKLVYDTANMIVGGDEPVSFFDRLAKDAIHVHVKDIARSDDEKIWRDKGLNGAYFASMPHGLGMIDFDSIFEAFRRNGYDGVLALEYVPRTDLTRLEDLKRVYRMFAPFCG